MPDGLLERGWCGLHGLCEQEEPLEGFARLLKLDGDPPGGELNARQFEPLGSR
jgi:hypothetical protein